MSAESSSARRVAAFVALVCVAATRVAAQRDDGSGPPLLGRFGWDIACPGDLDSDGVEDFAVESDGSGLWAVSSCTSRALWGSGAPAGSAPPRAAFARAEPYVQAEICTTAAAGDVDLDGTPDLLVAVHTRRDAMLRVLAIDGRDGKLLHAVDVYESPWEQRVPLRGVGDVDADGRPDYATAWVERATSRTRVDIRSGRSGAAIGGTLLASAGVCRATALEWLPVPRPDADQLWIGLAQSDAHPMSSASTTTAAGRIARVELQRFAELDAVELPSTAIELNALGQNASSFGSRIAAVGDVNGDGVAEVAAGAPQPLFSRDPFVASCDGRAGRFLGIVTAGTQSGFSGLGWCVERGPDVDRDGSAELMLTGPSAGALGQGACELITLRGNRTLRTWEAPDGGGFGGWGFGVAACTIGDVDADGVRDVAIGMCWHLSPHERKQVRVYSAGSGRFLHFLTERDMLR